MEKRLTYSEMKDLVFDTVNNSSLFIRVTKEIDKDGALIDILATRATPDGKQVTWIFELSTQFMTDIDTVQRTGAIRERLSVIFQDLRVVLITLGSLTNRAEKAALELGINVSSIDLFPSKLFELVSANPPTLFNPIQTRAVELLELLDKVPLGTPGWFEYQKLCSDIFEYLFCPTLDKPLFENPDASRRNRRDMIFPNNTGEGFWFNIRNTYSAHYIVVDAKNYSNTLKKKPVLELAHYLNHYGCGLFGILCSRKGPSVATIHAAQQEWISVGKMILALSDNDLREMINLKGSGNFPEEWLKRKIGEFRMAL